MEPETGETYEAGVRFNLGNKVFLQGSAFLMDMENEIVFVIVDPIFFIGSNENVGESRRYGFETSGYFQPTENLFLRGSYSYVKAKNLTLAEEMNADDAVAMHPSDYSPSHSTYT